MDTPQAKKAILIGTAMLVVAPFAVAYQWHPIISVLLTTIGALINITAYPQAPCTHPCNLRKPMATRNKTTEGS
jgi:hypothetical protein